MDTASSVQGHVPPGTLLACSPGLGATWLPTRRTLQTLVTLLAAFSTWTSLSGAQSLDSEHLGSLSVGRPPGASPVAGVDLQNHRSCLQLPVHPKTRWQIPFRGKIRHCPVVDEAGRIIVATQRRELVQLAPNGDLQWRQRLGTARAATPPVLLSSGVRVVLTARLQLWGVSPDGHVLFHRWLNTSSSASVSQLGSSVGLLPTTRDSVLVATRRRIVEVGVDGSTLAETSLPSSIGANMLSTSQGLIAFGNDHAWLRWQLPFSAQAVLTTPKLIPSRGITYLGDDRMLGVDERGYPTVVHLAGAIPTSFISQWTTRRVPAVASDGTLAFGSEGGHSVVWISPTGKIHAVKVLADQPGSVGTGVLANTERLSPTLLVDNQHKVMVMTSSGRVAIVTEHGKITWNIRHVCPTLRWMLPVSPGRALVACSDSLALLEG